jgi:outer membrane biosynthesis protein TonB
MWRATIYWSGPALVLSLLATGCCGDRAQREDMLRRRQYELDQRETRLRQAEQRFTQCVAQRYPGEEAGLEPPPAATDDEETGPTGSSVGGEALTSEQMEEIQRVERVGQTSVIACYTAELERRGDKNLEGSVLVKILIGTDGSAQRVVIGKSTLKVPRVHSCIVEAIRGWEFPKLRSATWHSTTFKFSPAY